MQVAFIVLSDGPCDSQSFRPNEDQSQWWSRRDALVRIVKAACCHGDQPAAHVHSIQVVFHNGSNKHKNHGKGSNVGDSHSNVGLSFIQPAQLMTAIQHPCEQTIIKAWKASFQEAEDGINDKFKRTRSAGGIASCLFMPNHLHQPRGTVKGAAGGGAGGAGGGELGKKDMVTAMQSNSSMEFLRKHHLNGSVELVLKKVNKAALMTAFEEWQMPKETAEHDKQGESDVLDNCFGRALTNVLGAWSRKRRLPDEEDEEEDAQHAADGRLDAVLLFLHEDYPHELPIFPAAAEGSPPQLVICVLGAVRDATPEEVAALQRAALGLGVPCLGAHLGRTAEFTSKIITSLVYHAGSRGALFDAVRRLQRMNAQDMLGKLTSIRPAGKTWDGYSTSTARGDASTSLGVPADTIIVVARLPCLPADVSLDMSHREKWVGLVQLAVATLWRSRMASDLADGSHAQAAGTSCQLVLLFADHSCALITQHMVAEQIAAHHVAAPCEHQVLAMLLRLLGDPQVLLPPAATAQAALINMRALVRADEMDEMHAIQPADVSGIMRNDEGAAQRCGSSALINDIYSGHCDCSSIVEAAGRRGLVVFLGNVFDGNGSADELLAVSPVLQVLYSWKHDKILKPCGELDDKKRKRLAKLTARLHSVNVLAEDQGSTQSCCPAGTAIAMLQHWSYHNRLFAGLSTIVK